MPKRPKSADPTQPHWIVVRMSKWDVPVQRKPGQPYFRHATIAVALAEAERLAAKSPGKRFSVYGSEISVKFLGEKQVFSE